MRTHIKIKALLSKRLTQASSLIHLFQNQNPFSKLGQQSSSSQSTEATSNHNDVKVGRYGILAKFCYTNAHSHIAARDCQINVTK